MATHAHSIPTPIRRRLPAGPEVAARRRVLLPNPTAPAIIIRIATRRDVARLVTRLIDLLDATEDTDTDCDTEDDAILRLHYVTGPGDADDAEPGDDDEPDNEDCCCADDDRLAGFRSPRLGYRPRPIATMLHDGSVPALGLAWVPIREPGVRS